MTPEKNKSLEKKQAHQTQCTELNLTSNHEQKNKRRGYLFNEHHKENVGHHQYEQQQQI